MKKKFIIDGIILAFGILLKIICGIFANGKYSYNVIKTCHEWSIIGNIIILCTIMYAIIVAYYYCYLLDEKKPNKNITKANTNKNIISCPKCGSTAITTGERGFKVTTGFIGAGKTVNRCGNCGHTWTPKG